MEEKKEEEVGVVVYNYRQKCLTNPYIINKIILNNGCIIKKPLENFSTDLHVAYDILCPCVYVCSRISMSTACLFIK